MCVRRMRFYHKGSSPSEHFSPIAEDFTVNLLASWFANQEVQAETNQSVQFSLFSLSPDGRYSKLMPQKIALEPETL